MSGRPLPSNVSSRFGRCAVVGNSGALLNYKQGKGAARCKLNVKMHISNRFLTLNSTFLTLNSTFLTLNSRV